MKSVTDIMSLILEVSSCLCVGAILGYATAMEYYQLKDFSTGLSLWSRLWHWICRVFWLSQVFGWCLLVWVFEEGVGPIFVISALLGFVVGNISGLLNPYYSERLCCLVVVGLSLCCIDFLINIIDKQFIITLINAFLIGLVFMGIFVVIFLLIYGVMTLIRKDSSRLSFQITLIISLLLISGGPFLWIVLATSVCFGYSWSSRYLRFSTERLHSVAIWKGFLILTLVHTLLYEYFYEIASYGVFWNPNIAVSPYALGGMTLGILMHRIALPAQSISH